MIRLLLSALLFFTAGYLWRRHTEPWQPLKNLPEDWTGD